jgi:hypothetical protein
MVTAGGNFRGIGKGLMRVWVKDFDAKFAKEKGKFREEGVEKLGAGGP